MAKLGRSYKLILETINRDTITIQPPFSVDIEVVRNTLGSASHSTIRVYNLGGETRKKIAKNFYDKELKDARHIELYAGYGSVTPLIFTGRIGQAWSRREGVNYITEIQGYDDGNGAYLNANFQGSFASGTSKEQIIRTLIQSMAPLGLKTGAIGSFPDSIPRGNAVSGNTIEILKQLTDNQVFIDNGKVYCLNADEAIPGSIQTITSSSGLLGTPRREEAWIEFDMIFEPRILIGQKIDLESIAADNFNGIYKVSSLTHKAMISDSVAGDAVTSIQLISIPGGPKLVIP